jgi:uncharacterized membrane protein
MCRRSCATTMGCAGRRTARMCRGRHSPPVNAQERRALRQAVATARQLEAVRAAHARTARPASSRTPAVPEMNTLVVAVRLVEAQHRIAGRRLAHYTHTLQGFLPGQRVRAYDARAPRRKEACG